jgi:uncharacterized protein (TIGR02679 family)
MTSQPALPAQLHAYLSAPALAPLWTATRIRLERNGLQVTGAVTIDVDQVAADHLSGLLGHRVQSGPGRRFRLVELDAALRQSAGDRGLISTLEVLSGLPLNDRAADRRNVRTQWAGAWQRLDAALAGAGLADAEWVAEWISGLRRSGVLTRAGTDAANRALGHAVSALKVLLLPTNNAVTGWELAALASQITGDAHGLDDTSLASVVLLRAAAHALDLPPPESAADRRRLWQALGVATDSVSGTVLTWQLRPPGSDRWSRMMRDRADLGLITHLTLHELDRAGTIGFATPGTPMSVCENPQVLQAAARAGTDMPLLCLAGNPASAGTRLLQEVIAVGAHVRYHGDFDWPGIAIAGRVLGLGAAPWRMFAGDYRTAIANLDADHAVALTGSPLPTPWDPELAIVMASCGLAIHEEFLLVDLLSDLDSRRFEAT